MKRSILILLGISLLASSVWADSIDEAEAKRRGVPVAQVLAENALAKEKIKTAALEKQVADLQKQLADLQVSAPAAAVPSTTSPSSAPSSAPASSTGPTPAVAAPNFSMPSDSPPISFDGPRAASPLYDDFVKRYLAGDWEKLAPDLEAAKKEIAALPAGNAADLTYISRVLAECRPVWWDQVKSGKVKAFHQLVWKQPAAINYQDGTIAKTVSFATVNGQYTANLAWPMANMDSGSPLSLIQAGLNINGDFGFSQGDGSNMAVWQVVGNAGAMAAVGPDRINAMSAAEKVQMTRYALFWQNTTAGYYCTPPARRLICAMSLASFEPAMNGNANWIGRRPLGAALLVEVTIDRNDYKGFEVQTIIGLSKLGGDMSTMESFVAHPVVTEFLNKKMTLEQDRHLREMIKNLALSNTKWSQSKLSLPGEQSYDLDPAQDSECATARMKLVNG